MEKTTQNKYHDRVEQRFQYDKMSYTETNTKDATRLHFADVKHKH